jgi:hypothetical protein
MELPMRTLLLLTTVVALAACDDAQSTTAPSNSRIGPVAPVQAAAGVGVPQAKPAPNVGFTTVTVVGSTEFTVLAGGASGGSVGCPDGTTRISGGYAFTKEGALTATPTATQSVPLSNGWFVRVVNRVPGAMDAAFTVFVLCAS